MQFRPVVSAIFLKIALKPMWLLIKHNYDILLIIISTARGEAVLFLAACYFLQRAIWGKIARFCYRSFILYTK